VILYQPSKVTFLGEAGSMAIPSDKYAQRTISWAKFRLGSEEFFFFNTHLPHNHGEASSPNTHAEIAQMLLAKREELGAASLPTVVVCDCNPFASNGHWEGSFEDNLGWAGIAKVYQAVGNPGYSGLDKIFASSDHWTWANGADQGTGGSDHPAIAADLTIL